MSICLCTSSTILNQWYNESYYIPVHVPNLMQRGGEQRAAIFLALIDGQAGDKCVLPVWLSERLMVVWMCPPSMAQ